MKINNKLRAAQIKKKKKKRKRKERNESGAIAQGARLEIQVQLEKSPAETQETTHWRKRGKFRLSTN